MKSKVCEHCLCYMLDMAKIKGWKKCIGCGMCKMDNPLITLEKYLMGRDSQFSDQYTDEIKTNAEKFLIKLNAFLYELGIINTVSISSGWRPAAINAALPNSAKRSLHMQGLACDIKDNEYQDLGKLVSSRPDLLKKYDLFVEDLGSTMGKNTNWCHIDMSPTRSDRPSRSFKP